LATVCHKFRALAVNLAEGESGTNKFFSTRDRESKTYVDHLKKIEAKAKIDKRGAWRFKITR